MVDSLDSRKYLSRILTLYQRDVHVKHIKFLNSCWCCYVFPFYLLNHFSTCKTTTVENWNCVSVYVWQICFVQISLGGDFSIIKKTTILLNPFNLTTGQGQLQVSRSDQVSFDKLVHFLIDVLSRVLSSFSIPQTVIDRSKQEDESEWKIYPRRNVANI
jgi:hypothetical protein